MLREKTTEASERRITFQNGNISYSGICGLFCLEEIPVSVGGLVATPPKEVANTLTSYLAIPNFPKDVPVYPYVIYAQDGFYLSLSDTLIDLPARFTFLYQGKDYSFTFSHYSGQPSESLTINLNHIK